MPQERLGDAVGLKVCLHGVRGSRPKHKTQLLEFGGNSTSIEFQVDENFYLFLDGGSGLNLRGHELSEKSEHKKFHFLITHTHWDHILGFPFFKPIYNADNEFTFYAPSTAKASFEALFNGLMSANHLPVPRQEIKAKFKFVVIEPEKEFMIENKVKIKTYQLNHQGITLGYRVEYKNASAIVITDNAPIDNQNYMGESMKLKASNDHKKFEEQFDTGLIRFLDKADLVVFDTHFTEGNLKPDWGHSTPPRALAFCKKSKVKRLALFHHAPEDMDPAVHDKVKSVLQDAKANGIEVCAAKEGFKWAL
jgi:phosphoribosyl 1,2-cyclic phosphodiesterase